MIGAALNNLFSEIFVSVYEQTANPRERDFSHAFKSCLRQQNLALQPFGEVPQRLAAYFTKSFHVDHLVMKSVKMLIEVSSEKFSNTPSVPSDSTIRSFVLAVETESLLSEI